nr:hypothetical protein [Escherichia coli]
MGEISVKTGNNARNGGKNSLNRLIRCVCGKKIGPDPRNFNQRVSLGRNDLLIRTFPKERIMDLKNNTVGIACGDFSAKCSDACIEKYNTGQLFGLDSIKADNPIKAKQGSSDASNY